MTAAVLEAGRAAGLAAVGVAPAEVLEPARTVLQLRKSAGFAGDMQFTYRNPDRSTDPETALSGARSFVAGAWSYGHWQRPESDVPSGPSGSIARYSWHDHYADLEGALQQMADLLIANGYRARVVADTNALVDRNVAWRAGLGWYGKNTNLLIPEAGSWFVLGSVVTDAVLEPSGPPLADGCGPCDRCRDECPTGAIVAPGVIDATRCLAWIVQAPGTIPIAYREAVGDRIYGCDDCQDVCPPNRVTIRGTGQEEGSSLRGETPVAVAEPHRVRADIVWLLEAEDDQILDRHGRWYIPRRDVDHVRRTALVVLGNTAAPRDRSTVPLLRRYLTDPNPMLRAHATWAAKRLGLGRLLPEDHADDDPTVQTEREASVTARFSSADWDGALAVGVRAGP
ncbi:MAG: tRNA epoxyqueuosine(34) reductase QueG [Actinomycetota bacterium]